MEIVETIELETSAGTKVKLERVRTNEGTLFEFDQVTIDRWPEMRHASPVVELVRDLRDAREQLRHVEGAALRQADALRARIAELEAQAGTAGAGGGGAGVAIAPLTSNSP